MNKLKLVLVLVIFLFNTNAFSQNLLKEGDSLQNFVKNNLVKFRVPDDKIVSDWKEGIATLYTFSKVWDDTKPILVFVNEFYPIGVLQGTSPHAYYIFDIDGDGILDKKTDSFILPYWVVYGNSKNKTKNDNLSKIMDLFYDSFQSDIGPYNNKKMIEAFNIMNQYKEDIDKENRDLIYLLFFYTKYSVDLPSQSLKLLDLFAREFQSRFNKIHPLIILFTAETLINLGKTDEAKLRIIELRKIDPQFIPAKAYEYKFETDKTRALELLNDLKKNHPNHWIVKQL